jgi:hypothetical protein
MPDSLIPSGSDQVADNCGFAQFLASFQSMEPFNEDKAVPIFPNQDRALLAYLQYALGDFTHDLGIERLSTLHRHIYFFDRKSLGPQPIH